MLALPVGDAETGLLPVAGPVPPRLAELARALLDDTDHSGAAGVVQALPRPGEVPRRLLLVGVGAGDEAGWRAAGAGLTRAAQKDDRLTVALAEDAGGPAVRGLVEGLLLAGYRFRLAADPPDGAPVLRQATVLVGDPDRYAEAVHAAQVTAEVTVRVRDPEQLAVEGFGGILAIGSGSARGPRLVELAWRPRGARRHVVLVGKGITFDSGGINLKTRDGMKLMRKDMGGAAAIVAATLAAAELKLPVRITALAPLAENMVSGTAVRPGDVVRHYGGRTSEIVNTDAEGRVVLADALAYAARRLDPDLLVDLATLTGANAVALGKRTAALYSESDELAEQLAQAAAAAGEKVWRLPLPEDYVENLASEIADLANAFEGGAGSINAALYLREFTGTARGRWAHLDMSAPSWADSADAELAKGATGWGVRTLLRWLGTVAVN